MDMIEKFAGMLCQYGAQTGVLMDRVTAILNKGQEASRGVPVEKMLMEIMNKVIIAILVLEIK